MRMKKLIKRQYDEAIAYDITKDFITVHENPVDEYPWVTFEIEETSHRCIVCYSSRKRRIYRRRLRKK